MEKLTEFKGVATATPPLQNETQLGFVATKGGQAGAGEPVRPPAPLLDLEAPLDPSDCIPAAAAFQENIGGPSAVADRESASREDALIGCALA